MKKQGIFALLLLALGLLTACSGSLGEPKVKTEVEIISDLEQREDFWWKVAPDATSEYNITDLSLNMRETDPGKSDKVFVTIIAESEYATYTGDFSLTYQYQEDVGYSLDMIYQDYWGTYSDIKLPTDEFAINYYTENLASIDGTLQEAAIEEISGKEDQCVATATFKFRDDATHATTIISGFYPCHFENGAWKFGTYESFQVVNEETLYDQANKIYWNTDVVTGGVELVNAYVVDGAQYCDRFVYYSFADVNYKDIIKYGFVEKELQTLTADVYIGAESTLNILDDSVGPIDEQSALQYIERIKGETSDILIILDAQQYLDELPGDLIISEEYIDEDGLNVAKVVHPGTLAYEEAIRNSHS